MPGVVASFGRGSPTGVVCYQHTQFPRHYRGALFVLDWTFGRVLAVPLCNSAAAGPARLTPLSAPKGDFGFAPTDAEVGPDGSLYISVGGRGTRGGVYKVTYVGDHPQTTSVVLTSGEHQTPDATAADSHTADSHTSNAEPPTERPSDKSAVAQSKPAAAPTKPAAPHEKPSGDQKVSTDLKNVPAPSHRRQLNIAPAHAQDSLTICLTALQPQSAWSRNRWAPLAKNLGRDALIAACVDPVRPACAAGAGHRDRHRVFWRTGHGFARRAGERPLVARASAGDLVGGPICQAVRGRLVQALR